MSACYDVVGGPFLGKQPDMALVIDIFSTPTVCSASMFGHLDV